MSRPQHQVSVSFNRLFLVSRHQALVATSLYGSAGFACWFLVSRHQSPVATSAGVTAVSSFQTCPSLTALSLSRPQLPCRDIIPLVFAQDFACLSCDACRDLQQISSIFLMSRPHNWTVHTQNCNTNQPVAFNFALPFELHFYSIISAFSYCFFCFPSLSLLITNW